MRRMHSLLAKAVLVWTVLGFAAAPAIALPAKFLPYTGSAPNQAGLGFEPAELAGLDEFSITQLDPYLAVTGPGAPVELVGTGDYCVLVAADPACRSNALGLSTAYTVIWSFEVSVLGAPLDSTSPFTLMLTGLGDDFGFGVEDVRIETEPTLPAGFESSTAPAFDARFAGFTPLQRVIYRDTTPGSTTEVDFLAWVVSDGDVVSFRMEVTNPDISGFRVPRPLVNATTVIPEPGTALLMGLGLFGLASVRGPRRA